MPWVVPVVMAAGAIYGGISGAAKQKAQEEAAQKAIANAAGQYGGIIPPEVKEQIVTELKKQGVYTPEMDQAISAGESDYSKIKEDQGLVDAQKGALQQMAGVSRTGFQASDRAALNKVRNQVATDEQGKQAQILQQMQSRGLGGSGAELAMQIAASQQGADSASEQADRLAAQAQQNALAAISQSGSMADSARNADFKVASAKASAADEMNRFNVSNQRDVAAKNVQNRNQAQASNLQESQRIYETNVANQRAEQLRQEAAKQQLFQNQMAKANALSGVNTQQANQAVQMGQNQANQQQGMWSGIGQVGGSIAKAAQSNNNSSVAAPDKAGGATDYSKSYLNMAFGGKVPGSAKVPGDHLANDTVPVNLSPGEIVVPRTAAESPKKAKDFVEKLDKHPKETSPIEHDIARHLMDNGSALHSLLKRINTKQGK